MVFNYIGCVGRKVKILKIMAGLLAAIMKISTQDNQKVEFAGRFIIK
jgi:hypothetical protein